jgi:hypothetical protein
VLQVAARRGEVLVPEERLYHVKGSVFVRELDRECVPKRVGVYSFLDAGSLGQARQKLAHVRAPQSTALQRAEQRRGPGHLELAPFLEPTLDVCHRVDVEADGPSSIALSV